MSIQLFRAVRFGLRGFTAVFSDLCAEIKNDNQFENFHEVYFRYAPGQRQPREHGGKQDGSFATSARSKMV